MWSIGLGGIRSVKTRCDGYGPAPWARFLGICFSFSEPFFFFLICPSAWNPLGILFSKIG